MPPRYSEEEAREAIAASRSYAEALRYMRRCSTGGSGRVLKKYVEIWGIPTDHFDPLAASLEGLRRSQGRPRPIEELLVEGSSASRTSLKERLYDEGLKSRACELCGQAEEWRGRRMSLILDHVNGVSNDNRLENLRIVCPNCNATLDTHCGRNAQVRSERRCARCAAAFMPKSSRQRYCSRACGMRSERRGRPQPGARRVERPPYEQLLAEIEALGWEATGRKYGVSGNAVRKWVRAYAAAAAAGQDGMTEVPPEPVEQAPKEIHTA